MELFLKVNLKKLLRRFLKSINKGLVNDKFNDMVYLRNNTEPDSVVRLIETYFADVGMILSELSLHVDTLKVDFAKLASLAREIEDKSTSIGAEHMRLACSDLIKACDAEHKKNFSRTLPWVKNEFTNTRKKLDAVVQMERRIIRVWSSQSSN
ncbi:histidine-containing phosphotransfer protein 3-like isoform X2 [Gastrolobium bilobum]|uniref:histidine-containing phosphotransfer protein 3-like isoform X2 n=1 Tax=Gastrolobium bilobum TaxID=150636 RepID=UPI002AB0B431|nr:histidine-containing phosphotransfer protein 3-like isoform X2 [Gastrolobium bilobum]